MGWRRAYLSRGPGETRRIGRRLGRRCRGGEVLGLVGALGSGKTCFVQGLARGLGVPPSVYVTSPTFVLIQEYRGRVPLFHFDLYRLRSTDEIRSLGCEEYFEAGGVCAVEWAEKALGVFPEGWIRVEFHHLSERERRIELSGAGL